MKYFFTTLVTLVSFSALAQNNILLDRAYWKTAPSVASVQEHIQKGSNPAEMTSANYDPVVFAISEKAPVETIKFLISQPGNDVNKLTHDGRTYLFWSASAGNDELMAYLLTKGAKVNMVDNHGANPLNFAAGGAQKNTKVYDLLLANGLDLKKDVNHDGANALLLSIGNDRDFTLVDYFASKGLDLNSTDANGNTAFHYVARTGNIESLKKLIAKGVKYNDQAFLFAAQGGRGSSNNIEIYQYLESLKLNPAVVGKSGENALHAIARKDKQSDIIKYFISKGVDVNKADNEGNTPFMNAAAANRDLAAIELLAQNVKDINQVNKAGASALALAVRGNSPEVVAALLAKGTNVSVVDAKGDNLAVYLVQSYTPQTAQAFDAKLKLLQEKGFDLSAPQKNGNNLYHLAVAKNDIDLLKRIESFKINADAKNSEGFTPLHKAVMAAKDDSIIKYLISVGGKKDTRTEFDETAYDLATENENLQKNKVSIDFLK